MAEDGVDGEGMAGEEAEATEVGGVVDIEGEEEEEDMAAAAEADDGKYVWRLRTFAKVQRGVLEMGKISGFLPTIIDLPIIIVLIWRLNDTPLEYFFHYLQPPELKIAFHGVELVTPGMNEE